MKKSLNIIKTIVFSFIWLLASMTLLFAQLTPEQENERKRDKQILERLENQRRRMPKPRVLNEKLTKEQKKRITPSVENVTKHRRFLSLSKTGIVKILPIPKCDFKVVDVNDLKCIEVLPILGMGSRYSFSEKSHTALFKAELFLSGNNLSVGFSSRLLGLIVDLGDLDINSVNLKTKEIQLLSGFLPTKRFSEISKQRTEFSKGFEAEGRKFMTNVPVRVNTTYAMHSINYYQVGNLIRGNYYDDITIVFRIIEIDSDDSVTLIWRELKKDSKVAISI